MKTSYAHLYTTSSYLWTVEYGGYNPWSIQEDTPKVGYTETKAEAQIVAHIWDSSTEKAEAAK